MKEPTRNPRGRGFAALGALLMLAAGCADPAPTTQPLVVPRTGRVAEANAAAAGGGGERGVPESELREQLSTIRRALRDQDYDRALELLDAFRALNVPDVFAREADAIRVEVKQHLLQSMYVDAFVSHDRPHVALGDPLAGEMILVNLSREPLTIPARASAGRVGASSISTMHVDVVYREYGLDGTMQNRRMTWNLEIGEDLVLPPGSRRSWPLNLDSLEFSPETLNYRTYTVSAMLYPAEIRIGNEVYPGNLRFRPRTCAVFPRNYEHLAERPLERLKEAVSKRSATHVPLAAGLIPESDHDEAVKTLVTELEQPEASAPAPLRVACCVGLAILTGEELPADATAWLAWSRDHARRKE